MKLPIGRVYAVSPIVRQTVPGELLATPPPDLELYRATRERRDATTARLTVARKIGKGAYHALRELEHAAA